MGRGGDGREFKQSSWTDLYSCLMDSRRIYGLEGFMWVGREREAASGERQGIELSLPSEGWMDACYQEMILSCQRCWCKGDGWGICGYSSLDGMRWDGEGMLG